MMKLLIQNRGVHIEDVIVVESDNVHRGMEDVWDANRITVNGVLSSSKGEEFAVRVGEMICLRRNVASPRGMVIQLCGFQRGTRVDVIKREAGAVPVKDLERKLILWLNVISVITLYMNGEEDACLLMMYVITMVHIMNGRQNEDKFL